MSLGTLFGKTYDVEYVTERGLGAGVMSYICCKG